jgi:hypothetical protein
MDYYSIEVSFFGSNHPKPWEDLMRPPAKVESLIQIKIIKEKINTPIRSPCTVHIMAAYALLLLDS